MACSTVSGVLTPSQTGCDVARSKVSAAAAFAALAEGAAASGSRMEPSDSFLVFPSVKDDEINTESNFSHFS